MRAASIRAFALGQERIRQPFAACPVWDTLEGVNFAMASDDLKQKDQLYGGFMSTLKWVVPIIAIIVFFVMMLISG